MILTSAIEVQVVMGTENSPMIVLTGIAVTVTSARDTVVERQTVSRGFLQFIRGPKSAKSAESETTRTSKNLNYQTRKRKSYKLQINVSTVRKQDILHAHVLNGTM